MDALVLKKPRGLTKGFFASLSIVLILLGAAGAILEAIFLNDDSSPDFLDLGAIALLLRALSLASLPIILFLMSEELDRIKNKGRAAALIFILSLAAEIPHNLIVGEKIINTATRSPAAAFLLCYIIAFLWEREKRFKVPLNIAVALSALWWSSILSIDEGIPCILIFAAFYWLRKKGTLRLFCTSLILSAISLADPLYTLALPIPALLHFYKE